MLRQARTKAVRRGKVNTSGRLSSKNHAVGLRNNLLQGSSSSNSDISSRIQEKSNYTLIRQSADNLQYYGEKLLKTGDNSLFASVIKEQMKDEIEGKEVNTESAENIESTENIKSAENTASELSEEELAVARKDAARIIENFIDSYNLMVKRMNQSGDASMNRYLKELKGDASASRRALSALGIVQNSDGTLKINEEEWKKAELSEMYSMFGKKGSLTESITTLAKEIEETAKVKLESQQTSSSLPSYLTGLTGGSALTSGNYNRYGNYASAMAAKNGGWYNMLG